MSNITKNQHFVPQFLLKNFTSPNETINIYDSARELLRPPTSVNRVLAENYFYDKDNSVEHFLRDHVEGPASLIVKQFSPHQQSQAVPLNQKSKIDVLRFLTVQLNRTPRALNDSLGNIDNFFDDLFKEIGRLNNFEESVINSVKFKLDDPKDILRMQTIEAAFNWPLINDLEWHFLINSTDLDFVISDHPVVHYNWYLRDSIEMDYTAITNHGVQMFLPLSPIVTLCLYDKKIYKLGNKNCSYTEVNNKSDINILNDLQFRSRESFIVFSDIAQSEYVRNKCRLIPQNSMFNKFSSSTAPVEDGSGQLKSTQMQWREQFSINKWLSFSKVKNKLRKKTIRSYIRRPDIVRERDIFLDKMRNGGQSTPIK
ncbi:hypothetical protein tinsulaeT_16220 [Thalassotalea insulae]|uniref:DUF4238 domain-containing protein n=1 Tax=Thalassotalea insulae TaxID=2056778 RepID=A0ABQ6GQR4_9GAMM|nr:DUF4238 domain-containing protein [Thalassotalea insulae]GLX78282.1 hypothetical protein tinsulaeT_16220 [Thalassotalea insulae]